MPSLTIITGCPGTGKTTISRQLIQSFDNGVYVEGDAFFRFVDHPIPPTLPESYVQNRVVLGATFAAAKTYSAGGYDVVVDGIYGPWFIEKVASDLLAGPSPMRFSPNYIILWAEEDETIDRATSRADADKFAIGGVRQMHRSFARESKFEQHKFDTTNKTASETFKEVAEAVRMGTHKLDLQSLVSA